MINIYVVLSILFIHWFADAVCQTHWQAVNKSTNNVALFLHVSVYSCVWALPIYLYGTFPVIHHILNPGLPIQAGVSLKLLLFLPITFICHFATDYCTSRLNSYLWKKNDMHNFFVSVLFDQFLHYTQLFLTFLYLTQP